MMLTVLAEYAAAEPVNPVRGSGVLALVVIIAILMIVIPGRRK